MPTDNYDERTGHHNAQISPTPWRVNVQGDIEDANGQIVARMESFHFEGGALPHDWPNARAIVSLINKTAHKRSSVDELQSEITEWADSTFPYRKPHQAWVKLFGEIGEVIDNPTDPSEWADVLIMLLDLAAMHEVTSLDVAVKMKLDVLRGRTWSVNASGVFQHVEKRGQYAIGGDPV